MATPPKKVTKKRVAKKAMVKRTQSTEVANLQQRLQNMAAEQSESVSPSESNKIIIHNDSQFKLPDGSIVDAPMAVVIVTFMARNLYYSKAWKDGVISPADCAAQGFRKNDDLTPYPAGELIDQQSDSCNSCWANEFGSHPTSDGKACQNRKQIAVLGIKTDGEGVPVTLTGEMLRFDTSPVATGKFDAFIAKIAKRYDRPACCFVVDADIMPAGSSHAVYFSNEEMLPENLILEAVDRVEEAKSMLDIKPMLQARSDDASKHRPVKKKAAARRR